MRFVSRTDAGLRPSRDTTPLSVSIATAHWGGDGPGVLDHDDCAAIWRAWQAQHMDTDQLAVGGANDIAYNAGVCQHGFVFEGRGRGVRSAANGTGPANAASYAIVYIGGASAPFTAVARAAFNDAAGWLEAALERGHRDWVSTGCPGDEIYQWVHAGHPAAPDEEDDLTKEERDTLNWCQAMMGTLVGGLDPDWFTAAAKANAVLRAGPGGDGGVSLEQVRADLRDRLA